MIEKKDILFGLIGFLFALSAIFLVVAQDRDNEATNYLIDSVIQFEKLQYLSNLEIINLELLNINYLDKDIELSKKMFLCSVALNYNLYNIQDTNFQQELYSECINSSSLEDILMHENNLLNSTYNLQNLSYSINPFQTLSDNFDEFKKLKRSSSYWKLAGLITFLIGFFIFYFCFLDYTFKNKKRL
jgi:hypothetical protein